MKTDRELLELAAKAAGLHVHCWGEPGREKFVLTDVDIAPRWNPLADDGDALRLVNKLGLTVQVDLVDDLTRIMDDCDEVICVHLHSSDGVGAATRRAITRAAAQVGADMKLIEQSREA